MLILQLCLPTLQSLSPSISGESNKYPPFLYAKPPHYARFSSRLYSPVRRLRTKILQSQLEMNGFDAGDDENMEDESDVSWAGGGFGGRKGEEKDYDRDPEFSEILGSCLDDPDKARSKMEGRLRKKRNKILHTKTGSPNPMKVQFNKFDFSNSYIWLEFYNAPLEKDVSLICDTIRSWHIVGRLGGCNSMNMQLSQSPLDKRPTYDAIQGANVTPTTFYNIGDLEVQDNLARIWVDIGTSEPLLLDILINALTQLSSESFATQGLKHSKRHIRIKLMSGGMSTKLFPAPSDSFPKIPAFTRLGMITHAPKVRFLRLTVLAVGRIHIQPVHD